MKRHILNTLLLLIALLLLPGWAWADVSWNFTSTPSADKTALKGGASSDTKADVSDHAVAFDSQANQALITNSNGSLKYYNTADITKIAIDKDTLYVCGSDWQDVYYTPKNVSFAKASGSNASGKVSNEDGKVEITEAKGWLESAYVKFKKLGDYTLYHVYIKGGDFASYTRIDSMLVRSYGDTYRADMVGLKAGNYDMMVVPVSKGKELAANANEATAMTVQNYDRSGFAHLNNAGVGAYNDDGSLKSDARVIYVTAQTAKTVTCEVKTGSKATNVTAFTGLQAILDAYQKGYETRPLDVRFIGLVEKADLDAISSSSEGLQIKGKKAYSNLYITLEGIGDDATLRGFGLLLRNAANVELRNFAIMRCMDDCVSIDTDNKFRFFRKME